MREAVRPPASAPPALPTAPSIWVGEPPPVSRAGRAALLLAPVAVVGLVWWILGAITSRSIANESLAAGGIFLTIVGPSVIFGPAVVGANVFERLTTWDLVAVTAFFTCATAFVYAYNLDLLERLPTVGPWLHRTRATMEATLEAKPWIRRFALFGVGFFVLLPLPGSGTLGGSIVGRIIGLSRLGTFVSVSVGGILVCLAYGWFGASLLRFGERHQLSMPVKVAGALAFLLVLTAIGRVLGRKSRATTASDPGAAGR
jgi:hypothetical protein